MDTHKFADVVASELGLPKYKVVVQRELEGINAMVVPVVNEIWLSQQMVEELTNEEICAVITHELAHPYHSHLAKRNAVSAGQFILSGINLFLPLPIWKKVVIELGMSTVAAIAKHKMFCAQEYEADEMSFRYHLQGSLVSALNKIEASAQELQKKSGQPQWMLALGSLTHPKTADRIARLSVPVINR
jgi:Zn-dependent protease with chaperone function